MILQVSSYTVQIGNYLDSEFTELFAFSNTGKH